MEFFFGSMFNNTIWIPQRGVPTWIIEFAVSIAMTFFGVKHGTIISWRRRSLSFQSPARKNIREKSNSHIRMSCLQLHGNEFDSMLLRFDGPNTNVY